uniref:NADP-dependent oxidoreductase domain-containing protein n=1 Tax=Chromera velia CCMP2878 TaxID=1169474 RepID=A0A0G4FX50_9ALVE|eukprot:Cvel_19120.t1-p1 / transcript=Cvel_19120.t1 / gene=Cvel_19120 / organism=Chromera_velia_CCMP2878 / gene_product=Protein tas, putative / transcript_product=Protein tas, putative / location=Cvel_scaffold1624:31125-36653(+) / protein_length=384 / sequence_SO=supercontig / SO=protein_coding / is_pseudo=false
MLRAKSSLSMAVNERRRLGHSELEVTPVCLGTMTWGEQNSEAEAHQQLDYAVKERGINFVDTAEMYPVPTNRDTQGLTEKYLGTWMAKQPSDVKDKLVVATKVSGFLPDTHVVAGRLEKNGWLAGNGKETGPSRHDSQSLKAACDASLRRLQTDKIDLYQLHWPDRYVPVFGATVFKYEKYRKQTLPFEEIVGGIKELIQSGKIRSWGVSNETPYGVAMLCAAADKEGCPRPVSIQNSFSLLHRDFEQTLCEMCSPFGFDIGFLPWSPLAGGALSGKYRQGQKPEGSRMTKWPMFQARWLSDRCITAIDRYADVAEKEGVSLATLALSWIKSRQYMKSGSTIIGATSMEQLRENIDAFQRPLSDSALEEIDRIHLDCKDPSQDL